MNYCIPSIQNLSSFIHIFQNNVIADCNLSSTVSDWLNTLELTWISRDAQIILEIICQTGIVVVLSIDWLIRTGSISVMHLTLGYSFILLIRNSWKIFTARENDQL